MPTTHDTWPGAFEAKPSLRKCPDCGNNYYTLNPRSSKRCGQCAAKVRLQQSRRANEKKRSARG